MPRTFDYVTGTYTGTGAAQDVTLGFKPIFLMIFNETDGDVLNIKYGSSAAATHISIDAAVSQIAANGITFSDRGFTAGSDNSVSENLKVFRYIAFPGF